MPTPSEQKNHPTPSPRIRKNHHWPFVPREPAKQHRGLGMESVVT